MDKEEIIELSTLEVQQFSCLRFGGETSRTYQVKKPDLKKFLNKYFDHEKLRTNSSYLTMPFTVIVVDMQSKKKFKFNIECKGNEHI